MSALVPAWARWLVLGGALLAAFTSGHMTGVRSEGQKHIDYIATQAAQAIKIVQGQERIVTRTEIKYRTRIEKIYVEREANEKQVPTLVTAADDDRCIVNRGFVRLHDAAWSGAIAGPAAEFDREPSGVPLSRVGSADVWNAAACRVWREQALGLREFYRDLKAERDGAQ